MTKQRDTLLSLMFVIYIFVLLCMLLVPPWILVARHPQIPTRDLGYHLITHRPTHPSSVYTVEIDKVKLMLPVLMWSGLYFTLRVVLGRSK